MGYTNEKCPIAFIYAKTVPTLINGKKKYENINASTRKLYVDSCICLLWMTNSVLMLIADDVVDGFIAPVSPITRFPGVPLVVAHYHDVSIKSKESYILKCRNGQYIYFITIFINDTLIMISDDYQVAAF